MTREQFDRDYPGLDPGIREAVWVLMSAGIETFESCQGGEGHAYSDPTVRFHGHIDQGWKGLHAALEVGLPVVELQRVWPVYELEPHGPYWQMVFRKEAA